MDPGIVDTVVVLCSPCLNDVAAVSLGQPSELVSVKIAALSEVVVASVVASFSRGVISVADVFDREMESVNKLVVWGSVFTAVLVGTELDKVLPCVVASRKLSVVNSAPVVVSCKAAVVNTDVFVTS